MRLHEIGAIYDPKHEEALAKLNWNIRSGYAGASKPNPETGKTMYAGAMHRIIWELEYGEPAPKLIDHINRNRLDNRVCNLRAGTPILNAANNSGQPSQRKYGNPQGCYFDKRSRTFNAAITHNGKAIPLGSFDTPEEAHAAYIKAQESVLKHLTTGEPLAIRDTTARRQEVLALLQELAANRATRSEICRKADISRVTLRKYERLLGLEITQAKRGRPSKRERKLSA
jgi:hypothetical protein